jgi:hypothetical protein
MEPILDVWEGSLDINEALLYNEGVRGIIVRLNDMNGGHHMDANFAIQWAQANSFLRAPYFVYNPWVSGRANLDWLIAHCPTGVTRLFIDIEVRKEGLSPNDYANEVAYFIAECKKIWPLTTIYTGGWFLSQLSHWPNCEYWWARYPYMFYPPKAENWTWEQLKIKLNSCGWNPDPTKQCSGTVKLWQLTGDRLILPGCAGRVMDVSGWNGDLPSLEVWWGVTLPPPPGPTLQQIVDRLKEQAILHGWDMQF